MQNEERNLIEYLIKAGFWSADDEGVPTRDKKALGRVLERMEANFVETAFLFVYGPDGTRIDYEIYVVWPGGKHLLAVGSTLVEVVCRAARSLADFFGGHPECARKDIEQTSETRLVTIVGEYSSCVCDQKFKQHNA